MEIRVDTELLLANELTPSAYALLLHLHVGAEFPWPYSNRIIKDLERKGFVKELEDGVVIRPKFKKVFSKYLVQHDVTSWIQEWRELWPKGVKSGGRVVRGDKQGCIRKMKNFLRDNPGVTKEDVFTATKLYVFAKKREDYKAIICADYFIIKDGSSQLSAYVEDIDGKQTDLERMEQGHSSWHKEI